MRSTLSTFWLALIVWMWAAPDASAQSIHASNDQAFLDFWQSNGWIYQPGVKEDVNAIDISEIPFLSGSGNYTVDNFNLRTFDPLKLALVIDPSKTTVVHVGDQGTLLFFSRQRVDQLYQRHQINQAATLKSQKK